MGKLGLVAALVGSTLLAGQVLADMYQDGSNSADAVNLKTLAVNKNLVYPNAPTTRILGSGMSGGATSGAGIHSAYKFNVDADDIDCSSAAGCYNAYFGNSFGGPNLKGHRNGIGIFSNLTAPTGNTVNEFYTGLASTSVASSSDGGTPAVPRGNIFAANFISTLKPAATNMNSLIGLEIDIVAEGGSSVAYKTGLTIVGNSNAVHGFVEDVALGISNDATPGTAGWLYGISFGMRSGSWPVDPSGTLIGTNPSTNLPSRLYTAANGIDFSQVTFSDAAFKAQGFAARASGVSVEDVRPLAAGIGGTIALKAVNGVGTQVSYGGIRSSAIGGTPGVEAGAVLVQTMGSGTLTDVARFDNVGGLSVTRSLMAGSLSSLTLNAGEIGMARNTDAATAPGAAGGKLRFVCGTTAGTAKLVAYAGTSATPVTVADNIGAGVSGC